MMVIYLGGVVIMMYAGKDTVSAVFIQAHQYKFLSVYRL